VGEGHVRVAGARMLVLGRCNALRRNVLQEPVGSLDVADRLVSHRQVHYLVFDDERKVVPRYDGGRCGEGAAKCQSHACSWQLRKMGYAAAVPLTLRTGT
jgi:hypothetical protein